MEIRRYSYPSHGEQTFPQTGAPNISIVLPIVEIRVPDAITYDLALGERSVLRRKVGNDVTGFDEDRLAELLAWSGRISALQAPSAMVDCLGDTYELIPKFTQSGRVRFAGTELDENPHIRAFESQNL